MKTIACCTVLVAFCGLAVFAEGADLRAAWFRADITPAVGTKIAGYESDDVSVGVLDPLYATGLCLDDGERKALIVSFDLLGIDAPVIRELRKGVAGILGVPEAYVLFTCTHTHGGPHSRMLNEDVHMKLDYSIDGDPPSGLDIGFMKMLRERLYGAVRRLVKDGVWRTVKLGYFSSQVDANLNRRFTTADNHASFVAHRRTLQKIATGIADKELGTVALLDEKSFLPVYVIGNYAAHALASHGPGTGGLRITSDFPGFYREYLKRECGADAMFVQGAAGDLIPKGDELGENAARRVGEGLAEESMAAIIDIQRNAARFVLPEPRLAAVIRTMDVPLLARCRDLFDGDRTTLEIQCLSIGDIAFVGVPGETVNELGLEIKWHSPFRRTFIAYCATGYFGYISPGNLVAAGGYEPQSQRFPSRDVLRMVGVAVDALSEIRAAAFPADYSGRDPYPDNLELPVLSLPGGLKATKKK